MENSYPPSGRMSRRSTLTLTDSSSPAQFSTPSSAAGSTLRGGTATRLTSAMPSSAYQRTGTSQIGFHQNTSIIADRPITQHGLSGLTTSQGRIGTAMGMRQVKDKRYWQAILQSKIQEIMKETERLMQEKKVFDREKSAMKLYEKKVKEAAKELSSLQSTLMDMNQSLDSTSSGMSRQQIQNEVVVLREKNDNLQNQLEQVFKDRQNKEFQNKSLEDSIENEKEKINELVYSLNQSDQNRYKQHQLVSEKLRLDNSEIHTQIDELAKQKEKLSLSIINSQSRLEAVKLLSKMGELISKRNTLKDEEVNRLTPAQEREKLITEVRINNQSLASITKQTKIVSDQLQEKRDYLQQIEQDLDEGSSERHIKYKELKKRDEMMESFMETFHTNMILEKQNIETLKNHITFAMEQQITLQGVNSKMKVDSSLFNEKNDLSSQTGLLKEYSKLGVKLKQLKILEKRIQKQLLELKQNENNLLQDIQKYSSLDSLRSEYVQKYDELSTALQDVKDKKRVTENVVSEAERRNKDIKDNLKGNETYRQISHLEDKLSDLSKENKQIHKIVEELNKEYDYSDIKREAQEKVDNYNIMLTKELKTGNL